MYICMIRLQLYKFIYIIMKQNDLKYCFLKKYLIILFFFPAYYSISAKITITTEVDNKDSLRKYSIGDLIRKSYAEKNMKIYCDEIGKRKLSDYHKSVYYRIYGEKYYFEIVNDFDKAITLLKISNYYAKKANDLTIFASNLNIIALIYAVQNKKEQALFFLKEKKKFNSQEKPNYQELLFGGDDALTYGVFGDFDKKIKAYLKAVKDLDDYLESEKKLPPELILEINRSKRDKYSNIVESYLLQKKLDSASFIIKKIKNLPLSKRDLDTYNIRENEIHLAILQGNLDDAIQKAKKDLKEFRNNKISVFYDSYYLAKAYNLKKNFKTSLYYCEQALLSKTISLGFINHELELYKLAMDNADKLGNDSSYIKYSKLYHKVNKNFDYNAKASFITKLYNQDQIKPLQYELNQRKNKNYYLLGIVLFLLLTGYFLWRLIKSKEGKKKFLEITERFRQKENKDQYIETDSTDKEIVDQHLEVNDSVSTNKENTNQNLEVDRVETDSISKENAITLAPEKEQEILKKLAKFENKEQFLSPNISLSVLAASLNVNSNYLSVTIKKHKKTNFNGYINQLRIDYIIQKMTQHPEYLTYKISYLAEECGFASHTTFTRIFIEKIGISPSKFISYLQSPPK